MSEDHARIVAGAKESSLASGDEEHLEIGADGRRSSAGREEIDWSSDSRRKPLSVALALGSTEFNRAPRDPTGINAPTVMTSRAQPVKIARFVF